MPKIHRIASVFAASLGVLAASALQSDDRFLRFLYPPQAVLAQDADRAATAAPLFAQVEQYRTTIASDPADIYVPVQEGDRSEPLPIALLLPGALVDHGQYSQFASLVARYGFAVVVPRHERSLPELGFAGELSEAAQISAVLAHMQAENDDSASPLVGRLNPDTMVLLGHSHGGAVGLMAIGDVCLYPFCVGEFTRPDAVVAGVFYGVNTFNPMTGAFAPTANGGIPVAFVQGSRDGVATPEEASQSYALIQDPPKALITVEGANHYGITNDNNPAGALPDRSPPTLEQDRGIEAIARWSALFLRAHALNDASAFDYLYRTGDAADDLVTVTSQPCEGGESAR